MRKRNEKLVLELIYRRQGLSQSEASQITGLKPPTLFRIFSILEEKGFIRPVELERGSLERKGRRPVHYTVIPQACYALGVDFWGRSASAVVVDFSGRAILSKAVDFSRLPRSEEVLDKLNGLIRSVLDEAGLPKERVLGIGLGAPGRIDIAGGRLLYYSRIQDMRDFPVAAWLQERFGLPVRIHNNASVIGLSEHRYGESAAARSLLVLVIRSGVGGAFIQDGKVFVNHSRTAMEIGHLCIVSDGRPCDCGEKGCLETYLSEDALLADLAGRADTLDQLDALLERRDPGLIGLLEERALLLITVVRNLVHIFGPDALLLVTRSRALADFFAEALRRAFREERDYTILDDLPRVVAAAYDPIRACHGAADLVFDHFFD